MDIKLEKKLLPLRDEYNSLATEVETKRAETLKNANESKFKELTDTLVVRLEQEGLTVKDQDPSQLGPNQFKKIASLPSDNRLYVHISRLSNLLVVETSKNERYEIEIKSSVETDDPPNPTTEHNKLVSGIQYYKAKLKELDSQEFRYLVKISFVLNEMTTPEEVRDYILGK